jgi:hypothetical protein
MLLARQSTENLTGLIMISPRRDVDAGCQPEAEGASRGRAA